MKKAVFVIIVCCAIIMGKLPLSADSKAPEEKRWKAALGSAAQYAAGISDPALYYSVYGEVSGTVSFLEIMTGVYRYQDYQITDGNGSYAYIGINHAGATLRFISDVASVYGGYRYARGGYSYRADEFRGGLEVSVGPGTLAGDYRRRATRYEYNRTEVKTINDDGLVEASYHHTDTFSIIASVELSRVYFKNMDLSYDKQLFRLGVDYMPVPWLAPSFGISAGKDSADYFIIGSDVGIMIKPSSWMKITALYQFGYFIAPEQAQASSAGSTGNTGTSGGTGANAGNGTTIAKAERRNPFLESSKIGKSYPSHAVSIGLKMSW